MLPIEELHLYIHIPFCRKRCDYCDFFTRAAVAPRRQMEIARAITTQAQELLSQLGSPRITTVYAGGGTPSSLTGEALSLLLSLLQTVGYSAEETTVEVNPEDVTPELLRQFSDAGVNRLSVGIQSLDEETLRRIGRHTSTTATRAGLNTVAERWTEGDGARRRWNADLIVGIPERDTRVVAADLESIIAAGPGHISVYELEIEPDTVLGHARRRGLFPVPDHDEVADELEFVAAILNTHGFRHYEISNFARPGEESAHNLGYWRMEPHLGLGPGAVGTIACPVPKRYTNTRDFSVFLNSPDRGLAIETLSRRQFLEEVLMMGFRTSYGIVRSRFYDLFGCVLEELIPETTARWGVGTLPTATDDGTVYRLAPKKRLLLNQFLQDAFTEIDVAGIES